MDHKALPAWHRHGDRGTRTGTIPLLLPENGACGEGGCSACHPFTCRVQQMRDRGGKGCTDEKRAGRREFKKQRRQLN